MFSLPTWPIFNQGCPIVLKAPGFWYQDPAPLISYTLAPLTWIYRFLTCVRRIVRRPQKAPFPVISVGNLVMGGAGKTPIVMALADLLKDKGYFPVVISKGYGGRLKGPVWVDPERHNYRDVGDEALLLARCAPTLVSYRRFEACAHIPIQKNVVIVLDDGHQQRDLCVDLSFLVENKDQGLGNGCVFPQGPLRESTRNGFKRTDAIFALGGPLSYKTSLPVFATACVPQVDLQPKARVWAVVGIGYPEKFKRTLETLKLNVVGFSAFPDHHPYRFSDMNVLSKSAFEKEAQLITTEKDWMRWPEGAVVPKVVTLKVFWREPQALSDFITNHLKQMSCHFKRDH